MSQLTGKIKSEITLLLESPGVGSREAERAAHTGGERPVSWSVPQALTQGPRGSVTHRHIKSTKYKGAFVLCPRANPDEVIHEEWLSCSSRHCGLPMSRSPEPTTPETPSRAPRQRASPDLKEAFWDRARGQGGSVQGKAQARCR